MQTLHLIGLICLLLAGVGLVAMLTWPSFFDGTDRRMIVVNARTRKCRDCPYVVESASAKIDLIFAEHYCPEWNGTCCDADYDYASGTYGHAPTCRRKETW